MLVVNFKSGNMSVGQAKFELTEPDCIQMDPKKTQQLHKIDPVDDAQCIELLNAWQWPFGFDLTEPPIGNIKLRAALGLGDLPAISFDLARRYPEVLANRLEFFPCTQFDTKSVG